MILAYKQRGMESKVEGRMRRSRCIIIGNMREPYTLPLSAIRSRGKKGGPSVTELFDRCIYMPAPSYDSRLALWRSAIRESCFAAEVPPQSGLSYATLASVSEGYSYAAITHSVREVRSFAPTICSPSLLSRAREHAGKACSDRLTHHMIAPPPLPSLSRF